MKFEKVNENKIKITLSHQDLKEKDIDFHSFMANSMESQDLFLDVLDEAEKKVGFITKNYQIRIEALALSDGDFILTVTRLSKTEEKEKKILKRKVQIKRKKNIVSDSCIAYRFNTFDEFCSFSEFIDKSPIKYSNAIAKKSTLYTYCNHYYLVFSDINLNYKYLKNFYSAITEFANYVNNSELFVSKLSESGTVVIKNNPIKTCVKYFIHHQTKIKK